MFGTGLAAESLQGRGQEWLQESFRLCKLLAARLIPVPSLSGPPPLYPFLGQEFPQDDGPPAQCEERHQHRQPLRNGITAKVDQKTVVEKDFLRDGQPHAGMENEVGDTGQWIIPTEVLEIEEQQAPRRMAQGVVRSEIGNDQGLLLAGKIFVERQRQPVVDLSGLLLETPADWRQSLVEEGVQLLALAAQRLQSRQTSVDVAQDACAGQAGFRGLADLLLLAGAAGAVQGDLELGELP